MALFIHRWVMLSIAVALLGVSFYLCVVRRPTRANRIAFASGAAFVVTMIAYTWIRS